MHKKIFYLIFLLLYFIQGKSQAQVVKYIGFDGPPGRINCMDISISGSIIVTGGFDGTVRLWDPYTFLPIRVIPAHTDEVSAVKFSPDNEKIISAGKDQIIKVIETSSGRILYSLIGHTDRITAFAVSPDGRYFISSANSRYLTVWDSYSKGIARSFAPHNFPITSINFSADGQKYITAGMDSAAKIWNFKNDSLLTILRGHIGTINQAIFSPTGKLAATCSGDDNTDKSIRIWNASSGELIKILNDFASDIKLISFSKDEKYLVSIGKDKSIHIWDVQSWNLIRKINNIESDINAVVISSKPNNIITAGEGGELNFWDFKLGNLLRTLYGHTDLVRKMCVSQDQSIAAASGYGINGKYVYIYNLQTGELLRKIIAHTDRVNSIAFSPDSKRLISGSDDGTAKLWNVQDGNLIKILWDNKLKIYSVAFSSDGTMIGISGYDNSIKILDYEGNLTKTIYFPGFTGCINSIFFSPNSKNLAVARNDGQIRYLNILTESTIFSYGKSTPSSADKIKISSLGNLIGFNIAEIIGSHYNYEWSFIKLNKPQIATGTSMPLNDYTFFNDTFRIATASKEGLIDILELKEISRYDRINSFSFDHGFSNILFISNDNKKLISGGWGYKNIRIIEIPNKINISPVSLGFTAIEDSKLPEIQQINIKNLGMNDICWKATSTASWLNISPSSGINNAVLNIYINTTDFKPGRYFTQIEISFPNNEFESRTINVYYDILPDYYLYQNYPNPFSQYTHIKFSVPRMQRVRVDIFNSIGIKIKNILDCVLSPGTHYATWIPEMDANVPSGIYYYRLKADYFKETKKMIYLKKYYPYKHWLPLK